MKWNILNRFGIGWWGAGASWEVSREALAGPCVPGGGFGGLAHEAGTAWEEPRTLTKHNKSALRVHLRVDIALVFV